MKNRILWHSLLNFSGYAIPLLVGIITIPWLLQHMGAERFGLLALVWAFTGYLTLFDFGLGRAMSQQVAKYINKNNPEKITQLFWDTHITMAGFGIIGTALAIIIVSLNTIEIPSTSTEIQKEIPLTLMFSALMIFPTLLTNGMNNFLLALEKFNWINALKIPLNTLSFVIPLWVTASAEQRILGILDTTCLYILISRSLFSLLLFLVCARVSPNILSIRNFRFSWPSHLLKLGGWMTVTNIIGPIMTYFDRFLISILLSPQAVSTYIIAYELASKLSIIPNALTASLAPTFAKIHRKKQTNIDMIFKSFLILSSIFIPLLLMIYIYADSLLNRWLGINEVHVMAEILRLMALGFYLNAIGLVFYTYLQYIGRPDLTAKLHLLELPIYIALLWLCLHTMGIIGAAVAWVIRAGIDMTLLLATTHYLNRSSKQDLLPI